MRVTVCQLRDETREFAADWNALVAHIRAAKSDLVLLPELPFFPWFATTPDFDAKVWDEVKAAHTAWDERLAELAPAHVISTRPAEGNGVRHNEAFAASPDGARKPLHDKRYLPNEGGFWEACWYAPGDGSFDVAEIAGARVGVQICTELWFFDASRQYGLKGADIIVTPRATPESSFERWRIAGRAAAISAGAFSLSSNHAGRSVSGAFDFAGKGWIISPDGEVLALTSAEKPFATLDIDLAEAREAKKTYPRYVR